jgi:probable selenium-dependent hydroxylase accessory protein YqeC
MSDRKNTKLSQNWLDLPYLLLCSHVWQGERDANPLTYKSFRGGVGGGTFCQKSLPGILRYSHTPCTNSRPACPELSALSATEPPAHAKATERDTSGLLASFGIDLSTRIVALVGGGGKTSLMYAIARIMQERGHRVVTTTTTRIFPPTASQSPHLFLVEQDPQLSSLPEKIAQWGHVTVGRSVTRASGKLEGISDSVIHTCATYAEWVIVEADGAAGRPVKAPETWEPVIPAGADLVIPVAGLDCLGKPASEGLVFRLSRFLRLTGLDQGDIIGPDHLAMVLTHREGGMKGVEAGTTVVPFLNKLDLLPDTTLLEESVRQIFQRASCIQRVIAGCLHGQPEHDTAADESPSRPVGPRVAVFHRECSRHA